MKFAKDPQNFLKRSGVSRQTLHYWRNEKSDPMRRPLGELRSKNYFLKDKTDDRLTGIFSQCVSMLMDDFDTRREKGKGVSTVWLRKNIKRICDRVKPKGYDPKKVNQFGSH